MTDEQLAGMKSRISMLLVAYALLFGASLVILIYQYSNRARAGDMTIYWALCLGAAVCTRLYRTSLVNKYNTAMAVKAGAPEQLK
jgi:hypothetical protein